MADIVRCRCGANEVRKQPGQTLCNRCMAKGVVEQRTLERLDTLKVFVPPSLYDLWETMPDGTKRRTPEYQEWIDKHVGAIIEAFWWVTAPIGIFVTVHGGEGFNESRDLDNCFKAAQDILQVAAVIPNDSVRYVVEIGSRYLVPDRPPLPSHATIRIYEVRR